MVHVNIYEAKTHLSRLIAQVESGEEVVLSRAGKPVARILPWTEPAAGRRRLGTLAGQIREAADVWDLEDDDVPGLMAAEPLFPEDRP
jgi:prevent-host-death family protein